MLKSAFEVDLAESCRIPTRILLKSFITLIWNLMRSTQPTRNYWSVYRNFAGKGRDSEIAPTEQTSL